ncbi:unnamed protein product [Onchocerca flexuosa]|uniref:Uncharacterized protein n=1 Tax=Onchocerca flexuosa TaxID=387005 RepID=A0A183I3L7_9BILA|nr:unnamed protein product [Onchocerca flexuosa]
MKLEVTVDEVFKWSPVIWLIGIFLCCLLMNFLCYCRRIYKRRQLMRIRRQEELLLPINLATSFPYLSILSILPHDLECCSGSSSMYRSSVTSLPSYNEVVANPHYMARLLVSIISSLRPTHVYCFKAINNKLPDMLNLEKARKYLYFHTYKILKSFCNYLQINEVKVERTVCTTATANSYGDTSPPNYDEAIKMFSY